MKMGCVKSYTVRNLVVFTVIVRNIKARRLIWEGHLARVEEVKNAFKILTVKSTGDGPIESLAVVGGHYYNRV